MNKLVQNLFSFLFPFYPFWAWFSFSFLKKPIEFFVTILLLPIALYFIIYVNKKLPKYLLFFVLFTIYHICSVYINNTFPKDTNQIYFLLSEPNILACLFFIVIEYTVFEETFISKMNRNILIIVAISLVVSLIQIKVPSFFFNVNSDEELLYVGENRNFSIYSWTNLNSAGVTFPILISILVSVYDKRKSVLPIIILSGIVVSFLTRARYVMISAILVLSQMFFNRKRSVTKRASILVMFLVGIFFIGLTAMSLGVDIKEIVNTRILEKDSDMASAKARVLSYEVFTVIFPEHPWVGVGPETKKDVIDLLGGEAPLIHVGYLSYLYFYGVAGCLLLFLSMFFMLRDSWRVGRKHNFWGSFYAFVSFFLANATFVYFNFSEMGIILSVIYLRYYTHISNKEEADTAIEEDKQLISLNQSYQLEKAH